MDISWPHAHPMINHFPVLGSLFGFALFGAGMYIGTRGSCRGLHGRVAPVRHASKELIAEFKKSGDFGTFSKKYIREITDDLEKRQVPGAG